MDNEAFKTSCQVPSPANIEKTGPYFHGSSAKTLEQAVNKMAKNQLDRTLTDEKDAELGGFLKSLTGEISAEYIKKRLF